MKSRHVGMGLGHITLALAFLVNRKLEAFDRYTLLGALAVVAGAITLFL